MALSRSAARTARHKRWLWTLTACGGAVGLVAVEGQLQKLADEHGQTTVEFAQERATEAASSLKKTTGIAGALLRTAVSSARVAVQRRNFDPGDLRADLAATVADLASETPTRRHLLALGGGLFLDWLLQLAYPQLHCSSSSGTTRGIGDAPGDSNSSSTGNLHSAADLNGVAGVGDGEDFGVGAVLRPGAALGQAHAGFGAAPRRGPAGREDAEDMAAVEATAGTDDVGFSTESLASAPASSAALSVAAATRLCLEAERALESILRDGVAAGLLLDRPGAVPLLLRAVAGGRASGGVADALAARAAEARSAPEAMTADLREAVEALRGCGGSGGRLAGGGLALQSIAAGLLSAWAAGSGANRAKLTGLGLQGVVAEVATAVSGLSDRAAVGLQWQLLRLARVMAEHSSSSDSHHLAACVLPLLYTAADAAAAEDAAMASYAVDTLAAAVRHGGAPVAEVVASSTMPHLLWQLAEGLGARRVAATATATAAQSDGKYPAAAAAAAAASTVAAGAGRIDGQQAAAAKASRPLRAWFAGRGRSAGGSQPTSTGSATAASPAGSSAATAPAPAPAVTSRKVMQVQEPAMAAAVAFAVAELARCALLPEAQVPRWRDWLLDVLCADGFDPGTLGTPGTAAGSIGCAATEVQATQRLDQHSRHATPLPLRRDAATIAGSDSSSGGGGSSSVGGTQQRLPSWLEIARLGSSERARGGGRSSSSSNSDESGINPVLRPVVPREPDRQRHEALGTVRSGVVAALSALSHMPGNHGLQAAHYWLSRLLSELAARTLPYTSLVYLEGPRAPQDLIHAVPVLPSYVKSVADALERAADAVADDSPPLPPHLEFDLAGSGLVARPTHDAAPPGRAAGGGGRKAGAAAARRAGFGAGAGDGASDPQQQRPQQEQQLDAQQQADVAAYRQAAHVVDVVVAERKAADALEALCAIVAPDSEKQRWLLQRGVLPLLHRLTRTADDPRGVLQEQGQASAERMEQHLAPEGMKALADDSAAAAATSVATAQASSTATQPQLQPTWHAPARQPTAHDYDRPGHHTQHRQSQGAQLQEQQQPAQAGAAAPVAVISEVMSDHEGGPSLCLQRQVARMLALLALLPDAGDGRGGGTAAAASASAHTRLAAADDGWMPWLRHAATSSDCRLSSNATRALLHLAAAASAAAPNTAAAMGAAAPPQPPVFLDGIHLLDPGAQHHWALVRQAAAVTATEITTLVAGGTAAATLRHGAETAPSDVEARTEGGRLPAGAGAQGAAVAMSMGAPTASAAELEAPPAASGGSAASASTVVSWGGDALATSYGTTSAPWAPAAAATLLSVLTWPWGALWGTTILAGPGLAAPLSAATDAAAQLSQLTVAAATVAEPLQTAPRQSASASPGAATPVDQQEQQEQLPTGVQPAPASAGTTGPGAQAEVARSDTDTSAASNDSSTAESLGPAAALVPYPAPYDDVPPPSALGAGGSDAQTVMPYTDGAAAAADADAPPLVDVVFVHGIRGGPFITWRKAGVMTRGSAASHMERSACWPSTWLAEDLPGARLLSVEYLAPVSAWEGESLPLEDNVSRVMGQLAAAGVGTGQRPVVFVAHSMGGLLVKEMLARSMDQAAEGGGPNAALAPSTRGIVFFGTPHFGNAMAAMGWKLRHLPGAHPAPSLARLTPGPHLLSLNERLRQLHDSQKGALRVVSLLEGQPTQLSGVIPRILVVAPDSAYPGFGAAVTLPQNDHIDCCKPASRTAPAYLVVRDLVLHSVRAAAPGGG